MTVRGTAGAVRMESVRRRLFAAASILSLLLCIASLFSWRQLQDMHDLVVYDHQTGEPRAASQAEELAAKDSPLWGACVFAILPTTWIAAKLTHAISNQTRGRRIAMGLCPLCGYSLTGNTSGTCPECGSPVPYSAATSEPKSPRPA